MDKSNTKKSETTSLSHKSTVGTTSPSSSTWNGSHSSKYHQRQKDEVASKMDTLQHEFTEQDVDKDGYITLKQLHSLFSNLNLIPPSQLKRFMNLVALQKSNLFTLGEQFFSFQETQQYHFLLERVAGIQSHISQKVDANTLMKIVQNLDEPIGITQLKDIYQKHELAFIRTMFQSLNRDEQRLIPYFELQSAVRKVQQENTKLTPERTEEILALLFEKSTSNDLKQKRPSNALVSFGIFAKGFIILESIIESLPLLGGNEVPTNQSNGTVHPPAPTTPQTAKIRSRESSLRSSVSPITIHDQESDDEASFLNTFSSLPVVPPVVSPRQLPIPAISSQMAYTYDPTPELFIEEVAPYRITPHSPAAEPPLPSENQPYQIRSRWKLYPVATPTNNNNVSQKLVSESILQTPVKSPPTSRSPTPKLSNGTPSVDSKLAVEKRITEEIIKLRQQLLEQRRKLADANLMYQHQQQTHEESIIHLKDNHQQQLNYLQQQIDDLKNQLRGGGRDTHTVTHKSVNTELNIAELLLHSQYHNNNNAALQYQYDEQSQAIEELRRNLEQLHADEIQLKRQLFDLQEVNEKLKESLKENDTVAQENANLRRQIQELNAKLDQVDRQKNQLQSHLTETHVSTLVQQQNQVETSLRAQLGELNLVKEDQDRQLDQLYAELQKYKNHKSEMEALQRKYQEAIAKNTQQEDTIRRLNEKIASSEKNFDERFTQYQRDVHNLTEQHQNSINSLQEKLTQVQQTHTQQEQRWKQEQFQQREKATQKLQEFEREINNYRNQLVEHHNLQERLKNATATQLEQRQEIDSLQQTVLDQRKTIEELQSNTHSSDSSRDRLQQELDQLKRILQEKDKTQEDLSKQIRDLKALQARQVQEIENLQKQVQTAQQGFQNQHEKTMNEFKRRETELQRDTEKLRIREQELITEITTLKSQNAVAVQQNQQQAAQMQSQNQQHSVQITELQRQLKDLQDQNKKLSDEHVNAQVTQQGMKKKIDELISINEGLLAEVDQTQKQVEEVQNKHQLDTDTKVRQLQDDMNALRQQLNTANREKTEHSQKITQLQFEKERLHSMESNLASELHNMKAANENLQAQLNQAQIEINNIRRTQSQAASDSMSQKQALENALTQAETRIAELEAQQNNQQDNTQQQLTQKVQQIQQQYADRENEFRSRVEKEKLLWKQKLKAQTDEVTNTIAQKLNDFSTKLAREAEQRIQLQQQNQQLQQKLSEVLNSRPTDNGANNYDEELGALNSKVRHQNDEIELLRKDIENLKLLLSKMENDEQATKMSFANFQKESKQAQDLLQAEKAALENQKDRLSRALLELNNKFTTEKNSKPESNRLHLLELGLKKLEQENKQLKAILTQHEINFENLGSPRGLNSEFTTRRTETRYVTQSTPPDLPSHSPHHHINYPSHDMPNLPISPSNSNSDLYNRVSSLRNRLDELNSSPSPVKSPPNNFVNNHYDFVYHNSYKTTYNNHSIPSSPSIPSTPQPPPPTKTPEPSPPASEEAPMDKYFQSQVQLPPFYEEDDWEDFSFSPPGEFNTEASPQPPAVQQPPPPKPVMVQVSRWEEPAKQEEKQPEPEPTPAPVTPNTSHIEIIPTDSPPMDLGNDSTDNVEEGEYGLFDLDKFMQNEIGVENNNQMMEELAKVYQDDEVSKKLAAMVANNAEVRRYVPFNSKRLEKGVYQIGNKKLQMKVINRELMVRVGGGYMKFEDYLKRHHKNLRPTSESEMKKEKEAQIAIDVHSLVVFPRELKKQQQESKKVWK